MKAAKPAGKGSGAKCRLDISAREELEMQHRNFQASNHSIRTLVATFLEPETAPARLSEN